MDKLAINGGTPAFQPDELAKLIPAWPPAYPETDIDSRDGQVLHKECVKRAKKTELPLFVSGMPPQYQNGTWIGSARWWHNRNKIR